MSYKNVSERINIDKTNESLLVSNLNYLKQNHSLLFLWLWLLVLFFIIMIVIIMIMIIYDYYDYCDYGFILWSISRKRQD